MQGTFGFVRELVFEWMEIKGLKGEKTVDCFATVNDERKFVGYIGTDPDTEALVFGRYSVTGKSEVKKFILADDRKAFVESSVREWYQAKFGEEAPRAEAV